MNGASNKDNIWSFFSRHVLYFHYAKNQPCLRPRSTFWEQRPWFCICVFVFVFMYLCIWQLGISVLMSLDLGLFKKYSSIRFSKVFWAWWRTTITHEKILSKISLRKPRDQNKIIRDLLHEITRSKLDQHVIYFTLVEVKARQFEGSTVEWSSSCNMTIGWRLDS